MSTTSTPGFLRSPRLLLAILALAATLRLLALDKPLYIDEIVTITVATQPLGRMGEVMRQIDASPGLYPLLLHGWLQVARADAWARALSAIFGVLAVLVVYLLGRTAFGERAGLAAAFVTAISPPHIHYAQYVRGYSLFTLLAALHLWLFVQWFRAKAPPSRSRFVLLASVTAAMLYTHYLSMLVFVPEALFAVSQIRAARDRVSQWAVAQMLAGVLFLPGAPLLLHNVAFDRPRNEERPLPPPPQRLIPNLLAELSIGQRALGFSDPAIRRATLAAAAVAFPLLLVLGTAAGWRANRPVTILLLLFAFLPPIVYVLAGRRLVAVRFFLPFMTAYLVLIGAGLASLRLRWRIAAAAVLIGICGIPLLHFYRVFEWSYDHRAVARAIHAEYRDGDALLFVHPYEAFYYRWYLGQQIPMKGLVFTALEDQGTYFIKPPPVDLEVAAPRVREARDRYRRLWLIGQTQRSFASDPVEEQRLLAWMDTSVGCLGSFSHLTGGDPVIRLYEGNAPALPSPQPSTRLAPCRETTGGSPSTGLAATPRLPEAEAAGAR